MTTDTKSRILDSAERPFADHGFDAASLIGAMVHTLVWSREMDGFARGNDGNGVLAALLRYAHCEMSAPPRGGSDGGLR